MTDQILATSAQASVTCAQLPERQIGLGHREMMNASGGIFLIGNTPMMWFIAQRIVEAVVDYVADDD